jgi:putative hydrolase of the HAD superfamily
VAAVNRLTEEKTMKREIPITTLFLDIGGVLLTDGWSHGSSKLAAKVFGLNLEELKNRHNQALDTHELGKLTIEEYLSQVVFYEKRPFTPAQFRKFMFAQSKPYPKMIELVRRLKTRYGLKIIVVSNEGRGLNEYRIRKFKLDEFVDSFISSCFVQLRKPDADIFRVALNTAQVPANQVIYIENTPMFVQIAEGLGIRSILHTDYKSTRARLASLGLQNDEGVTYETS